MNLRMKQFLRLVLLVAVFAVLYSTTAQKGWGWGDSGVFQHWILDGVDLRSKSGFSNLHPFYIAVARAVATTPFHVTLISSFFGALAVGGMFLCTRRVALTALFGLSQMLWWLSCVAEVQTMSLAMTAFETWLVLTGLDRSRGGSAKKAAAWMSAAAFLAGVHLSVHNFALLALPVYAVVAYRALPAGAFVGTAACWALGALPWMYNASVRGLSDVLVGSYGAKVFGLWPANWTQTGFNFFLAALSFVVPAALVWWHRKDKPDFSGRLWIVALFAVNLVFWIRYFVPDQSQFLLPTLFYAYVLLKDAKIGVNRLVALALVQFLLPVFAFLSVSQLPVPEERRGLHGGRDDARYFILSWKA